MKVLDEITINLNQKYSEATVAQYRTIISSYIRWLHAARQVGSRDDLLRTTPDDVGAYLATFPAKSSASKWNRAITAISAMYKLLDVPMGLTGLRARNKRKNYPIEPLTKAEADIIIDCVRYPYKIILGLMFYSGTRLKDVLAWRVADIDLESMTAAGFQVSDWAERRLRVWIEDKRLTDEDLVFAIRPHNLRATLNRCVNKHELYGKNITPQSFVYGCAKFLWEQGYNDAQVKAFMGCSTRTLYRYKKRAGILDLR